MAINFAITADNSNFISKLRECESGVATTAAKITQSGQSIEEMFGRIGGMAKTAFAGFAAKEFIGDVAEIRGEFQKLEVAFSTILGNKGRADALMSQIIHTAAITSFGLNDVANGAKQLLAYGIAAEDVNEVLIRLGDIAAGLSLPLNDLVYLYGTTMTQGRMFTQDLRQFQGRGIPIADALAKQFGVAKNEIGDLVTAGRVGAKEFNAAIMSLSGPGGQFHGLMGNQSKTISGQIANIQDSVEVMFNEIGQSNEGVINLSLEATSSLVEHWQAVGEAIMVAVTAYGSYKAAVMVMDAYNGATTNISYRAELEALQALLPAKEASRNADLDAAVASGSLAQSKAEQIAVMREEAAAYVDSLKQKATAAALEYESAINEERRTASVLQSADDYVDACTMKLETAIKLGDAEKIERAETELGLAVSEKEAAVRAHNTALTNIQTASKNKDTAATTANTAATQLDTAAKAKNTVATGFFRLAVDQAKTAVRGFTAALMSNPLIAIAAAVTTVVYGIYKLVTAESAAERQQRLLNEQMDEFNKKIEERQDQIKKLIRTITDESSADVDKVSAWSLLTTLIPDLAEKYDLASFAASNLANSEKELNEYLAKDKLDKAKEEVAEYETMIRSLNEAMAKRRGVVTQKLFDWTGQDFNLENFGLNSKVIELEEKLKNARNNVRELEKSWSDATELAKPIELRITEAKENKEITESVLGFYSQTKFLLDQLSNPSIFSTEGVLAEIDVLSSQIVKKKNELSKDPIKYKVQLEKLGELEKSLSQFKTNWDGSPMSMLTFQVGFNMDMQQLYSIRDTAQDTIDTLSPKSTENYAQAVKKANDELADARKKTLEAQKSGSVNDYKAAKQAEEKAELAAKDLGIDVSKKTKKTTERADDPKQNIYEAAQLAIAEEKRVGEMQLEEERRQEELRIAQMNEGLNKRMATIELNAQKERDALQKSLRQEAEILEKNDLQQWLKGGKDRKEYQYYSQFSDSQLKSMRDAYLRQAEENIGFSTQNVQIQQQEATEMQEIQREQLVSMRDYLKEYGSYEQQKLAITEEYAEKIKKARENGMDGEAYSLERERQSKIQSVDNSAIMARIDWYGVFGSLGGMLSSQLEPLYNDLKKYVRTDEFSKSGAENQKAVVDAMENMRKQIGDSQSWKDLASAMSDYQLALQELKRATDEDAEVTKKRTELITVLAVAENKLKNATSTDDKTALQSEVDTARLALENYNQTVVGSGKKVQEATSKVNGAGTVLAQTAQSVTQPISEWTTFFNSAGLDQIGSIFSNIDKIKGGIAGLKAFGTNGKDAANAVSDIAENAKKTDSAVGKSISKIFGESGGFIAQIASAALSILDILKDGIGTLISSLLDSIFNTITGILDNLLSGEMFKQIGNSLMYGIGGVVKSVFTLGGAFDWIGSSVKDKTLDEDAERYEKINGSLAEAIDRLSENIKKGMMVDISKNLELALRANEEEQAYVMELFNRAAINYKNDNLFGNGGHESGQYHLDKAINLDEWKEISKLLGKTVRAGNFQTLTAEELYKLATQIPYLYEKIQRALSLGYSDASKYMDQLVELYEQVEELNNTARESLTDVSFDSLRDDFKSALLDMESDSEAFTENFAELMRNAVIESMISNFFNKELQTWYNSFAEAMDKDVEGKNQLTTDEMTALKDEWDRIMADAMTQRDQLFKTLGLDEMGLTGQSATTGGYETMSEDTGRELVGQYNAQRLALEEVKRLGQVRNETLTSIISAIQTLASVSAINPSANDTLTNILNQHIISNMYLEDITKYTKMIKTTNEKLDSIINNTNLL